MPVLTDPEVVDFTEMEEGFAKPCFFLECDHEAEWAVWIKHAGPVCPLDTYMCEQHKTLVKQYWDHVAGCGKHKCNRCNVRILGKVSDFLRYIKL